MENEEDDNSDYDEEEFAEAFEINRILKCSDFYEVMEMEVRDFDANEEKAEEMLREQYMNKTLAVNPSRSLNRDAKRAFQLLTTAYDCLSDPLARATYNGDDPELTRVRRVKEPPLLEALADTLHEMTEEQELRRKGTVFKGVARGLLWVDKMVNKQVANRRSLDNSSDSLDDATTQSTYNEDSSQNGRDLNEEVAQDNEDLVGTSWRKSQTKLRRATYSKIDKGSKLRRLARDFLKLDTVFSSVLSISKESRRRQQQREQEGVELSDRDDYDSDTDTDSEG